MILNFDISRRCSQASGGAYGASRRKILELMLIESSIAGVGHDVVFDE
jgi:hypothetical protein